jgi:hypothetical protein
MHDATLCDLFTKLCNDTTYEKLKIKSFKLNYSGNNLTFYENQPFL